MRRSVIERFFRRKRPEAAIPTIGEENLMQKNFEPKDEELYRRAISQTVDNLIDRLKDFFIDELDEIEPDAGQRLLRLFDVWRQVSLRRIVDLAESADVFFHQGRLLPANTLTRSTVETVAVQFTVWKKLDSLTDTLDISGIHELLMSVVFGRRDKGAIGQTSQCRCSRLLIILKSSSRDFAASTSACVNTPILDSLADMGCTFELKA